MRNRSSCGIHSLSQMVLQSVLKKEASLLDLLHGLLPLVRPVLPPPFLAPFIAAFSGSAIAWRWPNTWIFLGWLLAFGLLNIWIVRWPSHWTVFILLIIFTGCALHQMMLVQAGRSVQDLLSGEIQETEAIVRQSAEQTVTGWGRVVVQLPDRSLVQLSGKVTKLLPGQKVHLLAKFSTPSAARNPGGMDEARVLACDGIFLKADLLLDRVTVTDPAVNPVEMTVKRVRDKMAEAAMMALPEQQAALLLGILIGDTSRMAASEKQSFQSAGLSHLMAVSGANVTFILIPILFFLQKTVGKRRVRSALLIIFLILFGFLTGWEPSVTRAILMMGLMFTGQLFYRRCDPLNALLFAGTAMLMANPLMVISSSFHLSFLATVGILLFSEPLSQWFKIWLSSVPSVLLDMISINLAVQITVLPLQIQNSGQFSPFALLANLAAMPLAEGATLLGALDMVFSLLVLILPGYAITLPFVGTLCRIFAWPARFLLESLSKLADLFAGSFWLRVMTGAMPILMIMAYVSFVTAFLIIDRHRSVLRRIAAVLLLAATLLQARAVWIRPDLEIVLLDVGQGDCTLIRTREGTVILIDAGTESAGHDAVRPTLQALGIASIDLAILTHGHEDHAGGLLSLLEDGLIQELYVSQQALQQATIQMDSKANGMEADLMTQVLDLATGSDISVHPLQKGDTIPISSSSQLTVLAPESAQSQTEMSAALRNRGANAFNLVLKLTALRWSMLLAGDCDRETEELILRDPLLDADLLRVAHHGSAATTSQRLLQAVTPDLALISVGENDYGHPAPAMLDRLDKNRIPVIRTDQQGAITICVNNGRCTVKTMFNRMLAA